MARSTPQHIVDSVIDDLKNSNLTQVEIAKKHGVSITTVWKYRTKHRVKRPESTKRGLLQPVVDSIINDLRTADLSQAEIGKKYGVSGHVVHKIKHKLKIARPADLRREAILADIESGMTLVAVAEKYGVTEARIGQLRDSFLPHLVKRRRHKVLGDDELPISQRILVEATPEWLKPASAETLAERNERIEHARTLHCN